MRFKEAYQRERAKNFVWQGFGWILFMVLGWWARGFFTMYFGTNVTFTEVCVKMIDESGGVAAFITLFGVVIVILKNMKDLFKKRSGD